MIITLFIIKKIPKESFATVLKSITNQGNQKSKKI